MATTFTINSIVHVWARKGCRDLATGPSSSERLGGDYPDILPSEDLVVIKAFGKGSALCRREDGTLIRVHANHVDASAKYNTKKKGAASSLSTEERIKLLQAQLALFDAIHAETQRMAEAQVSEEEAA